MRQTISKRLLRRIVGFFSFFVNCSSIVRLHLIRIWSDERQNQPSAWTRPLKYTTGSFKLHSNWDYFDVRTVCSLSLKMFRLILKHNNRYKHCCVTCRDNVILSAGEKWCARALQTRSSLQSSGIKGDISPCFQWLTVFPDVLVKYLLTVFWMQDNVPIPQNTRL